MVFDGGVAHLPEWPVVISEIQHSVSAIYIQTPALSEYYILLLVI